MRKRDLIVAAAGALVATVLAGGVAWAAIPGPGGMIEGCYKKNNGQLRVVDTAGDCLPSELALSWNQQGPQGVQGTQGPQGPSGTNGSNGQDGTDGEDGVSVTSTGLSPGDANCPEGGSQFTAVNGDTYACNGAPGQDGAEGSAGPPGPSGISGYEVVKGPGQALDPFEFINTAAGCPAGKRVLGGGYEGAAPGGGVSESLPSSDGTAWNVNGQAGGLPGFVRALAVCATVSS